MQTARFFLLLSAGLLFNLPAWSGEAVQVAKVYRDYPGYLNPAVCENPNLGEEPVPLATPVPVPTTSPASGSVLAPSPVPPAAPQPAAEAMPTVTVPPKAGPQPSAPSLPSAAVSVPPVPPSVAPPAKLAADQSCCASDPTALYLTAWAGFVDTRDADLDASGSSGEMTFEHGYAAGAAAGYDFGPARLEIEGSYRRNSAEEFRAAGLSMDADGDLKVMTLFANAFVDFTAGGTATPYLGAGIGYADVELDDHDDSVLAGQLAAGVFFPVSRSVSVDIGYRYLMTEDPELAGVDLELNQHVAMLGLQFRF